MRKSKESGNTFKRSGLTYFLTRFSVLCWLMPVVLLAAGISEGENIIGVLIPTAIFLGLAIWITQAKNRSFVKDLKKFYEAKGVDKLIQSNSAYAVKIYNSFPKKAMLKYITGLNPQAGDVIRQAKASKNKR